MIIVQSIIDDRSKDDVLHDFLYWKFHVYREKKYEIHIFYLHGEFYSMCIFNQENEKMKMDFRNYDYANPNRDVRFQLPSHVQEKLDKLMINLDPNSGSIDMIYTQNGEFVFLEVNSIGQFVCLFKNCICHIPNHIADDLSEVN